VSRFDGRVFANLTAEDGMPRGLVGVMAGTRRSHLDGSRSGLLRYDSKAPSPRVRAFTTADGLPAENVTALITDKSGRLWVGTSKGLCLLRSRSGKVRWQAIRQHESGEGELLKDLASGGRQGALAVRPTAWRPGDPQRFLVAANDDRESPATRRQGQLSSSCPSNIFNDLTKRPSRAG
jgi:hypothetical protein